MTASAPQPALFPDAGLAPLRLCEQPARKFGRGATPQIVRAVELPQKNPTGHRVLKFCFRPLKRHSIPYRAPVDSAPNSALATRNSQLIWEVACDLIALYFQRVGGFLTADDEVVRLWSDALATYSVEQIVGAIAAKAESLRPSRLETARDKRIFVPRVDRFVAPKILERWITQSAPTAPPLPEGERLLRAARLRERLSNLKSEIPPAAGPHPSSLIPHPLAADRLAHRLATAARDADHHRKLWSRLTDLQHRAIQRECLKDFDELVHDLAGADANPHDGKFDALQVEIFVAAALRHWPSQML